MSETRGVFKPVEFLASLRKTGRFTPDGDLSPKHDELAANAEAYKRQSGLQFGPNEPIDMFLYRDRGSSEYRKVQVLGQMEPQSLPDDAFMRTVKSLAHTFTRNLSADTPAALAAGRRLINELYGRAPAANEVALARAHLSQAALNEDTGILSGNEFGTHDLPAEPPAGTKAGSWLPFGYGNVAGLFTIASVDRSSPAGLAIGADVINTAANFRAAVEDTYDAMAPLFSASHIAFTGERVPAHFASSHAAENPLGSRNNRLIAFAQNLLDTPKAPLYLVQNGGGSTTASSASLASELGSVEGADADEQRALAGIRQQVASTASPAVAGAFATAESLAQFRTAYEASSFAASFARYESGKATDPAEKQQLRGNKTFAMFIDRHLSQYAGAPATMANVLHGVVSAVRNNRSVAANVMEATLATMAATSASPASASSSSSSSSSSRSGAPVQAVLTRLTHSPSALARSGASSGFVPSAFHDLSATVNLADGRAVSEAEKAGQFAGEVTSLFAHSAAGPSIVYNAPVGSKRKAFGGYSGASELDEYAEQRDSVARRLGLTAGEQQTIDASDAFKVRALRLSKVTDETLRLAGISLLLAPVKYDTFERMYNNDVRVPLSILGERPLRRYETASAIYVAGGRALGEIAYAKFAVHLASNASTHDLTGNASIWCAAFVRDEERYFIAENVMVTGYGGGESLKPFSPDANDRDTYFNPAVLHGNSASVLLFLEPGGSLRGPNAVSRTHDIRGRFDEALVDGRLNPSARALIEHVHHPSALFYNMLYQLGNLRVETPDDGDYFRTGARQDNTITHQTMQWIWNPRTDDWDRPIYNTDHFGINIYEGHGDLRAMNSTQLYEDMHYRGKYPPVD